VRLPAKAIRLPGKFWWKASL